MCMCICNVWETTREVRKRTRMTMHATRVITPSVDLEQKLEGFGIKLLLFNFPRRRYQDVKYQMAKHSIGIRDFLLTQTPKGTRVPLEEGGDAKQKQSSSVIEKEVRLGGKGQ